MSHRSPPRLHYAAARSDKEAVTRLLGICEQVEAQTRPDGDHWAMAGHGGPWEAEASVEQTVGVIHDMVTCMFII